LHRRRTPLHLAADIIGEYDVVGCVAVLVANGAAVTARNNDG
jgi:hypothetical protein